ncbi:exonuclease domain-containing protein [bacterium]|nr:exonuclease domain-containing protein [bacterium]
MDLSKYVSWFEVSIRLVGTKHLTFWHQAFDLLEPSIRLVGTKIQQPFFSQNKMSTTPATPATPTSSKTGRYSVHNHGFVHRRRPWTRKPLFDYYLVVDFEATCDNRPGKKCVVPRYQMEVIEFPMVLVDAREKPAQVVPNAEFQTYVKPVLHTQLTPFCVELTGITQHQVDNAPEFAEAYERVLTQLQKWNLPPNTCVVTCGNWDFRTMFPAQLLHTFKQTGRKAPFPALFKSWCNVPEHFKRYAKTVLRLSKARGGMASILKTLRIPLTGRHHSGIDDCHNIAKIVVFLLNANVALNITESVDMAFFRKRAADAQKFVDKYKSMSKPHKQYKQQRKQQRKQQHKQPRKTNSTIVQLEYAE